MKLLMVLLWASLASNIILLMWIYINGNAAKRMDGILTRQADTIRYNSELGTELLKEMNKLNEVNIQLRGLNDKVFQSNHDRGNRIEKLNKSIVENGGNPDKI
jgi:hypothetical protein